MMGKSTKRIFFLLVGGRKSKFLASGAPLLILCHSRENTAIWFQIGPKQQNFRPHHFF